MNDLISRLRGRANSDDEMSIVSSDLMGEAADEIELLRGTVQDLIDAYLADVNPNDRNETAIEHARRHLEQPPQAFVEAKKERDAGWPRDYEQTFDGEKR